MSKYSIDIINGMPYAIGSTVFAVVGPNKVLQAKVRSYKIEVCSHSNYSDFDSLTPTEEYLIAGVNAITTEFLWPNEEYFKDDLYCKDVESIPIDRVFSDKKEAEEKAKFFKIDFNETVWLKAIGKRDESEDNEDPIDESELGICCANISNVRDLLYKAYEFDGLVQFDIDQIIIDLKGCCPDLDESPNLSKILNSLGITKEIISGK